MGARIQTLVYLTQKYPSKSTTELANNTDAHLPPASVTDGVLGCRPLGRWSPHSGSRLPPFSILHVALGSFLIRRHLFNFAVPPFIHLLNREENSCNSLFPIKSFWVSLCRPLRYFTYLKWYLDMVNTVIVLMLYWPNPLERNVSHKAVYLCEIPDEIWEWLCCIPSAFGL